MVQKGQNDDLATIWDYVRECNDLEIETTGNFFFRAIGLYVAFAYM